MTSVNYFTVSRFVEGSATTGSDTCWFCVREGGDGVFLEAGSADG